MRELNPPAIVARAEADLASLAAAINAAHEAGEQAQRRGLEHYRAAGEALLKAKAMKPHGTWLPWLKEWVRFDARRAQRYMELAKCDVTSHLEDEWRRISGNAAVTEDDAISDDAPADPAPSHSDSDLPSDLPFEGEPKREAVADAGVSAFTVEGNDEDEDDEAEADDLHIPGPAPVTVFAPAPVASVASVEPCAPLSPLVLQPRRWTEPVALPAELANPPMAPVVADLDEDCEECNALADGQQDNGPGEAFPPVQGGGDEAGAEPRQEEYSKPKSYPNSDRLVAWVRSVAAGTICIAHDFKEPGKSPISVLLSQREKVDFGTLKQYVLPMLQAVRDSIDQYVEEIKRVQEEA